MKMNDLLTGLENYQITGDENVEITSIAYDSRKVRQGSLFVCIDGFVSDGHEYIKQATDAGAAAIMVQKESDCHGATCIMTPDTRIGLAVVSANYFDNPSAKLHMIGVTGTKGKTTATFMINSVLEHAGRKTALIGTILNKIGEETVYASRTTPESYELQAMLDECVTKKIDDCIMEVSSQGLWLHRVYGCNYDIGVFTNLYNDHIGPNEHENMEDYALAKAMLFTRVSNGVVNIDADYSQLMIDTVSSSAKAKLWTIGIDNDAMIMARDIKPIFTENRVGTEFTVTSPWYNAKIFVGMPGKFNVYNALSAIACAGIMGIGLESVQASLSEITVSGRVQPVKTGRNFQVIVDYAHNAASLENILNTLRDYVTGRLVCVFGCGGDRAKSRRFEMGEVSGRLSDFTIITSDNPRTENPESILSDIETGIKKTDGSYLKVPDRTQAIRTAILMAKDGDVIVIAGKGHETYQIFADKTIHYDDVEVARSILGEMGSTDKS
jgi:UDP-N-acetylmuramoyl-L-alanyl-D-glutamate--2,6-diaminopimelate ligase